MLVKVLDCNETHIDVDVIKIEESLTRLDFHAGVAAAVFVTIMSEMGDKSFFVSAILAMRHSQTLTFLGSVLGQAVMTAVAVVLGMAASFVPVAYTKWASCVCMICFGLKMLKEGFGMPVEDEDDSCFDDNENDINSVGKICEKHTNTTNAKKINSQTNLLQDIKISPNYMNESMDSDKICLKMSDSAKLRGCGSTQVLRHSSSSQQALVQAFTLSFFGEWGDRSQIATILLASTENPYGVAVGSIFGHIICSLTAVLVGRQLGQKFPVKTITKAGGVLFLLCAVSTFVFE